MAENNHSNELKQTKRCTKCGAVVVYSPRGQVTGCEHHPIQGKSAWTNTFYQYLNDGAGNGPNHPYAAHRADEYCDKYLKMANLSDWK